VVSLVLVGKNNFQTCLLSLATKLKLVHVVLLKFYIESVYLEVKLLENYLFYLVFVASSALVLNLIESSTVIWHLFCFQRFGLTQTARAEEGGSLAHI